MDATNSSTVSVRYEWGANNGCDFKRHCVDTVIQGNAVMMLTLNGRWWYDFAGAEFFF